MARTQTKTAEAPLLSGIVEPEPKPSPVATTGRAKATKPQSTAVAVSEPRSSGQRSLMSICLEAATRKGVTPEKVKAYLDMAHEEELRGLEREFDNLMIDARSEMPVIVKDAWNPHTKSHYAKLEKVSQQIDGIARKYGFQHTYGMADSKLDNHYRVICDLVNRNGFKRRYYIDIGSDTAGAKGGGTKSGAQGSGSSVSYARRYLKFMVWDLVLAGEDQDAQRGKGGELITADQTQELSRLMRETNTVAAQFYDHFEIEELSDLPQTEFKRAKGLLERKKEGAR